MVAQITPVQRQRQPRVRPSNPAFAHADILSRFGETICIHVAGEFPRQARVVASQIVMTQVSGAGTPPIEAAHGACEFDEEPERWDGMA